MIQRIQSIFLLLASGAGFSQFALPYLRAETGNPATMLPVFADGVLNPMDNIGLIGLCVLSGLISLVALFMFKNRTLQARLTGGALAASVLLLVLVAVTVYQTQSALPPGGSTVYQAGLGLPFVEIILQWLAGRSIRKDENLVRSMDRLR